MLKAMGLSEPIFNKCEIEIRAPPALVQSVLMDFDRYRDWTHQSQWSITTDKKVPDLKPGDIMRVDLGGMSFRPTLVVIIRFAFTF
ncbi:activator of hsp90 atpase 1 family protein [Apiospora arundinis]|uniref:Activator of hsp90 atpase 1 family protein n=1 Tax=Apiospora arundinis TaxID=335852 RepID=A0ABR2IUE1_9PEZI